MAKQWFPGTHKLQSPGDIVTETMHRHWCLLTGCLMTVAFLIRRAWRGACRRCSWQRQMRRAPTLGSTPWPRSRCAARAGLAYLHGFGIQQKGCYAVAHASLHCPSLPAGSWTATASGSGGAQSTGLLCFMQELTKILRRRPAIAAALRQPNPNRRLHSDIGSLLTWLWPMVSGTLFI